MFFCDLSYLGSHKLALFSIAGGFLGECLHQYRESYTAERDLQMFHYICLHPEDFPKQSKANIIAILFYKKIILGVIRTRNRSLVTSTPSCVTDLLSFQS